MAAKNRNIQKISRKYTYIAILYLVLSLSVLSFPFASNIVNLEAKAENTSSKSKSTELIVRVDKNNKVIGGSMARSSNINVAKSSDSSIKAQSAIIDDLNLVVRDDNSNILNPKLIEVTSELGVSESFDKNGKATNSIIKDSGNKIIRYKIDGTSYEKLVLETPNQESIDVDIQDELSSTKLFTNTSNKSSSDTYDIAILSVGYGSNTNKFKEKAEVIKNNILTGSFFRDKQNRINITRIDHDFDYDKFKCTWTAPNDLWCTDILATLSVMTQIDADSVVLMVNFEGPGASAYLNKGIQSISNFSTGSIGHELGHSLGGLSDEYIVSGRENTSLPAEATFPNCKSTCSAFDVKYSKSTCTLGCNYGKNSYKLTPDSIMNHSHQEFDALGYDVMDSKLNSYSDGNFQIAGILGPNIRESIIAGINTFTWSKGKNVSKYKVTLGSKKGLNDLNCQYEGTNTSLTCDVGGPVSVLYVRVSSQIDGNWAYNDYTYNIYDSPAEIFSPKPNSVLPYPSKIELTSGGNVASYEIKITKTSSPTSSLYFSKNIGTAKSYTLQYQDLLTGPAGKPHGPDDKVPLYIHVRTHSKSGGYSDSKVVKVINKVDTICINCNSCNLNSMQGSLTRMYPQLRVGNTYSYGQMAQMLAKQKVNLPIKNLNFSRISDQEIWAKASSSSAGSCTLMFDMTAQDKYKYKGLQKLDSISVDKSAMTLSTTSSNNFGSAMIVIEGDMSVTPYQVKF